MAFGVFFLMEAGGGGLEVVWRDPEHGSGEDGGRPGPGGAAHPAVHRPEHVAVARHKRLVTDPSRA